MTPPLAMAELASATRRGIRPLRAEDLATVAALRQRTFASGEHNDTAQLAAYCEHVFLNNPWHDDQLPSLVYEDDGHIVGFIGVIPRTMVFGREVIRVAVVTQMMVAPEARGLAGRELVRMILGGPQDLTITDTANEPARRVWKSVGAAESVMQGFAWERVLRPLQHLRSSYAYRPLSLRVAGVAALPLLMAGDALASWRSEFAAPKPEGVLHPLDPSLMAAEMAAMLSDCDVRPSYDASSLAWLIDEARQKHSLGHLVGGLVRDSVGSVAGWFLHYVTARGMSHAVQVVARRSARRMVMDHLLHDAWRRGAIAVSGRLDATLLPIVEDPRFVVRRQAPWTLYHSNRPEITRALESGVFLSRLDGEYWLRF